MALQLTPGQTTKTQRFRIYFTDGNGGWVVVGGGAREGNPFNFKKQKLYKTEDEAWAFIADLRSDHPEIFDDPTAYHTLYYNSPSPPTFLYNRSRPVK